MLVSLHAGLHLRSLRLIVDMGCPTHLVQIKEARDKIAAWVAVWLQED